MSFLWLKSLGNKILGCVTSLFGLSSAGGTKPADKQNKIPTNALFTQTMETEPLVPIPEQNSVNETKINVGNANNPLIIKNPNNEISEKQKLSNYFHEILKQHKATANMSDDELKAELQKIRIGIRNKIAEFKRNLPKDKQHKKPKKRLSQLESFLYNLTCHKATENLDTLVCTLELMLEDDTVSYSDKLHIVLMELNEQLGPMDLGTKKDKIKKIASSCVLLETKNRYSEKGEGSEATKKGKIDEALEKVTPWIGKLSGRQWTNIMSWVLDKSSTNLPDGEARTVGKTLLDLTDTKLKDEQKDNRTNDNLDNKLELDLKKLLSEYWHLYPGPRKLIAECLFDEKINELPTRLEKALWPSGMNSDRMKEMAKK